MSLPAVSVCRVTDSPEVGGVRGHLRIAGLLITVRTPIGGAIEKMMPISFDGPWCLSL